MISSLMLICAVLASLALGVLAAYGLCGAMFSMFRVHARSTARERDTRATPLDMAQELT